MKEWDSCEELVEVENRRLLLVSGVSEVPECSVSRRKDSTQIVKERPVNKAEVNRTRVVVHILILPY
jgi:hypothetical protein